MLIIAHRGGHRSTRRPENTLACFRAAIAAGVEAIEFDVQMTRDGGLVVFHDRRVDRTTNGRGALADHSLAEIRALDAGQGERVPLLAEVLELVRGTGVRLLLELKTAEPGEARATGLEAAVVNAVEAAGCHDQTIFASFTAAALARLRALRPGAALCALYKPLNLDLRHPPAGAQYIGPGAEVVLLRPRMLRPAPRPALAWVVFHSLDRPWLHRRLYAAGVAGLITDWPIEARRLLAV